MLLYKRRKFHLRARKAAWSIHILSPYSAAGCRWHNNNNGKVCVRTANWNDYFQSKIHRQWWIVWNSRAGIIKRDGLLTSFVSNSLVALGKPRWIPSFSSQSTCFYKPIDSKLRAGFQLASICASRRWIQLESSWPANNVTFGKTFKVDSHQRERETIPFVFTTRARPN